MLKTACSRHAMFFARCVAHGSPCARHQLRLVQWKASLPHIPMSRGLPSSQQESVYDRMGRWYGLLAQGFEDKHRNAGVRALGPGAGDAILVIGCGSCRAIVALAAMEGRSGRIYGLDLSKGMVNLARRKVERASAAARVALVRGDARRLPFKTSSFDGILISFVPELFAACEVQRVLMECRRILQPGGDVCVVALSKRVGDNLVAKTSEWLHRKFPQYVDCRPILVRESLERAGFRTLYMRVVPVAGLHIERALAEKPLRDRPGGQYVQFVSR